MLQHERGIQRIHLVTIVGVGCLLDEVTVIKKIDRLYDAMESLGTYAEIYPIARLNAEWISKGYQEFICEDFHFAYKIYTMDDGEKIIWIHDAVHSLLYH